MSPTVAKSFAIVRSLALICMVVALPAIVRAESIPRPEGIQTDVNFWVRVYTEVTTNEGFLHDERNLAVIYQTVKFSAGSSPRERQQLVDDEREKINDALRRIVEALPTEAG